MFMVTGTDRQPGKQTSPVSKSNGNRIFGVIRTLPPNKKALAVSIISLLATVLLFVLGMQNLQKAYHSAEQSAYEGIYQTAYNMAEARNHVSNYAVISVEYAKEVSRLEVLTVSGSEFVIKNADETNKITSWLEVQGTGVFTIDLSMGEFIVDSERHYVLVRIPKPMLTDCKLSGTGKQFWKDGRIISNGSVAEGVRLSQAQMREGQLALEASMMQNRTFYDAAQEAAKRSVESLIQQWNPNIPDLFIRVEFIENP